MQAVLRVEVDGELFGEHVLEVDQLLTVGRADDADLTLVDPRVSRLHVTLELRPDAVYVLDHGSRNGTYLGANRLPPETPTPR